MVTSGSWIPNLTLEQSGPLRGDLDIEDACGQTAAARPKFASLLCSPETRQFEMIATDDAMILSYGVSLHCSLLHVLSDCILSYLVLTHSFQVLLPHPCGQNPEYSTEIVR